MEDSIYFVSYVRTDSELALRLACDLRAAGVALWMDQLDLQIGERWDRSVEGALQRCQGMFALLSPESLASDNVMDEISFALEKGKRVLPIVLRSCEIPFRLRRVQHVELAADYEGGIRRLLRAVGAPEPETAGHSMSRSDANSATNLKPAPLPTAAPAGSPAEDAVDRWSARIRSQMAAERRRRRKPVLVGLGGGLLWGLIWGLVFMSDLEASFRVSSYTSSNVTVAMGVCGIAGAVAGRFTTYRRKDLVFLGGGILIGCALYWLVDREVPTTRADLSLSLIFGSSLGAVLTSYLGSLRRNVSPRP